VVSCACAFAFELVVRPCGVLEVGDPLAKWKIREAAGVLKVQCYGWLDEGYNVLQALLLILIGVPDILEVSI
jgi:hypothetical protein